MLKPKTPYFSPYTAYNISPSIFLIYGFNKKTKIFFIHALESMTSLFFAHYHNITWHWLSFLIPNYSYIFQQKIYALLLLLNIRTYRSFRLLLGYPTRGQRTWSNANTVRTLNPTLLILKTKQLREYTHHTYTSTEVLSEYINFIWYLQWNVEWQSMRKNIKFHKFFRTQPHKFLKFDDIINFRIEHFAKEVLERKKFKNHRKKRKINKNSITGGFKFGFVSYYGKLLSGRK